MAYTVRQVADDAELIRLWEMAVDCAPAAQCNTARPHPTLEQLRKAHRVYVAYLGSEPVAFALCSEKRMTWLTGRPEHVAPACVEIADVIHHEFADAWGEIGNAELRAAIAAASGGRIEDDGTSCRWIGD